ncbi:glucan endo-1,3-beta-D-glucosidase 1 [Trichomonascus vanleenenianus]|uniref:glucan endo-1,3-beta-D-glucosidase n=1 Tax=Trichomonascus vanleenenianus TaxID=2268995 RepID=UPI003ECB2104
MHFVAVVLTTLLASFVSGAAIAPYKNITLTHNNYDTVTKTIDETIYETIVSTMVVTVDCATNPGRMETITKTVTVTRPTATTRRVIHTVNSPQQVPAAPPAPASGISSNAVPTPIQLSTAASPSPLSTAALSPVQPPATSPVVRSKKGCSPLAPTSSFTPKSKKKCSTTKTKNSKPCKTSSLLTLSTVSSSSAAVSSAIVSSALPSSASSSSTLGTASIAGPSTPAVPSTKLPAPSGNKYYNDGSIFSAVDTSDPPSIFPREDLRITIPGNVQGDNKPIETNKFYANMLLDGAQHLPVYTFPYSVWWSNDTNFPGMAVSYVTFSQRVYGPNPSANPVEYYINPVGLMDVVLSANEFTNGNMAFQVSDFGPASVNARISNGNNGINFTLAQGMGLVTGEFDGVIPFLYSQLGFSNFTKVATAVSSGSKKRAVEQVDKYTVTVGGSINWVVYVSGEHRPELTFDSQTRIRAENIASNTIIQVGILPDGADEDIDSTAGQYITGVDIDAEVQNDIGYYTIKYNTAGNSACGEPFIYALPHHIESVSEDTKSKVTSINVDSTTKGVMTGVLTSQLQMAEALHTNLDWLPWKDNGKTPSWDSATKAQILASAKNEMQQDISGQVNVASTYTGGKAADKFAYILLTISEVLDDEDFAKSALQLLKDGIFDFTQNKQPLPLMYDTKLKGVTSTGAQGGDTGTDYGSPYYNDHHFHYGYWVHASAVVAYVDQKYGNGTWLDENKAWVNSLIRDVANPTSDDSYFPIFRMFDWYHGHSWAAGMFSSAGGKNEESSSEDYNFAYGMKLWAKVIGDMQMEARADLMLSVLSRSMDAYFYMKDNNTNQPQNFIKNKVPGITFENQLDHTTYFGTNLEYIQGIHMIPITPVSALMRQEEFVQQEWEEKLAAIINTIDSGWTGILRINQALFDADASYEFFSQDNFNPQYLDNGASLTWYLAYSSGMKSI